jgi:hypothetical protein
MDCGLHHAHPLPNSVRPETPFESAARDLYPFWVMALGVTCIVLLLRTPVVGILVGVSVLYLAMDWWAKAEHRVEDAAGLRAHRTAGR